MRNLTIPSFTDAELTALNEEFEDLVVAPTGYQFRKAVEIHRESVHNAQQFMNLEVHGRGFAIGAAFRRKLLIEVPEESGSHSDGSAAAAQAVL